MQTHCYKLVEELKKNHTVYELIWKNNYPRVLFFLTVVIRAFRMLKQKKGIDAIYVNDGLMALISTPLLRLTNVPIYVTIHGLDVNFPWSPYQWWVKNHLSKFHKIIAVSKPTLELCIQKGLPQEKLVLVKNAVDINFEERPINPNFKKELSSLLNVNLEDKFLICSLGRAIPRKGFSWFAKYVIPRLPENIVYIVLAREFPEERLFNLLEKLLPNSLFEKIRLMVGAEVDARRLQNIIKEQQLANRVFHLSEFTQSRSKIFEVIKHSDLYVMPNLKIKGDYEGFGLVALEAASQGTLTLASNVDGIPSAVIDGENGYLIEGGNAALWINKIMELYRDPDQISTKSKEFQKNTTSTGRSWETMAHKYVQVFLEA